MTRNSIVIQSWHHAISRDDIYALSTAYFPKLKRPMTTLSCTRRLLPPFLTCRVTIPEPSLSNKLSEVKLKSSTVRRKQWNPNNSKPAKAIRSQPSKEGHELELRANAIFQKVAKSLPNPPSRTGTLSRKSLWIKYHSTSNPNIRSSMVHLGE